MKVPVSGIVGDHVTSPALSVVVSLRSAPLPRRPDVGFSPWATALPRPPVFPILYCNQQPGRTDSYDMGFFFKHQVKPLIQLDSLAIHAERQDAPGERLSYPANATCLEHTYRASLASELGTLFSLTKYLFPLSTYLPVHQVGSTCLAKPQTNRFWARFASPKSTLSWVRYSVVEAKQPYQPTNHPIAPPIYACRPFFSFYPHDSRMADERHHPRYYY